MPAPNPPIAGLEVSPVYEKLGAYISRRYSRSTDVFRLAVLSIAYATYCRKKKEQVAINMRLNHNDWKHPTVVRAYTQFENDLFYEECCKNAEIAIKSLSEDSLIQRLRSMFAKNPAIYILEQGALHFLGLVFASILTVLLIGLVATIKSGSIRETAHDLGALIIDIGQAVQGTF